MLSLISSFITYWIEVSLGALFHVSHAGISQQCARLCVGIGSEMGWFTSVWFVWIFIRIFVVVYCSKWHLSGIILWLIDVCWLCIVNVEPRLVIGLRYLNEMDRSMDFLCAKKLSWTVLQASFVWTKQIHTWSHVHSLKFHIEESKRSSVWLIH